MSAARPRVVVARAVLPVDDVPDVIALYLDAFDPDAAHLGGRGDVTVRAGRSVSFGSYFNSFPAAYWQHLTRVRSVRLTLSADGAGTVRVLRSDESGRTRVVEDRTVDGPARLAFDLPLTGFDEGGAYWFDVAAGDAPLSVRDGEWTVDEAGGSATATVAMATFNRPADCLAQLRTLADDAHVGDVVDRIVVVDQGEDRVSAQPGFAEVSARLGDRLVLLRQRNLGGSGGFSRGMAEALRRGESDYVLLLDDDAISEPEAIVRAVRFAEAASTPVIVGGGMLHLDARSTLYAQAEQWDERIGWVRLDRPGAYDHDFAKVPFRDAPYFHRRQHADFNGWWMCLIPARLLREAGLALPLFLKGDDVEFALRAREHGVETVSIPGIALWHMGWGGKAPTRTWEAYFLHRNRLITELLHAPRRRPWGVIGHSLLGDLKPLLSLQYSAVRLRAQADLDVLAGPAPLPDWLATRAAAIRAEWSRYPDAIRVADDCPTEGRSVPQHPQGGRARQALALVRVWLRHLFVPASRGSRERPAATIPAGDLGWWTFARIDSALVEAADGRGAMWHQRSRSATVRALWLSLRLHARLAWSWPRLARDFTDASGALASTESWARAFEA